MSTQLKRKRRESGQTHLGNSHLYNDSRGPNVNYSKTHLPPIKSIKKQLEVKMHEPPMTKIKNSYMNEDKKPDKLVQVYVRVRPFLSFEFQNKHKSEIN